MIKNKIKMMNLEFKINKGITFHNKNKIKYDLEFD